MKKLILNLFSLALIGLFSLNVSAEQISQSDATSIATDFLSKSNSISTQSSNKLKLAYTAKAVTNPDKNCFFVFNRGVQEGFIIVAADDCTLTSVLGYSNNGEFDGDNMPPNFKWWMEQYQREIDYAIKNNLQLSSTIRSYSTSVSPLLGNIAWDQGDPYNLLCPTLTNSSGNTERTVTGCVATATAQVMRYHKWPATGTGSNSYTWKNGGKTLTMDFSQSTYDWENMTETYNSNSTTTQKNAVAKLMYDCGISCNMEYGLSEIGGSSASSLKQAFGLYNYFGYDKGMRHVNRDYYQLADWEAMITNELNNNRPILYHGTGSGGGHAFVIDGYDKDGRFHFNWGWGGRSNGYFVTTALNPGELGIGGGAGGYNYNQGMTIGVQPAQSSSTQSIEITSDGLVIKWDELNKYGLSTRIMNQNWNTSKYDAAWKMEATDSSETIYYEFMPNTSLDSYYYWNTFYAINDVFGRYITNGTYKVSLVVREYDSTEWRPMPTLLGKSKCVYMTFKDGEATTVIYDESSLPNLSVTEYELNDKLYINRVATISTTIKNTGTEYLGDMAIVIADRSGNIIATSGLVMANIPSGETKDIIFDYTMISLADGVSISTETPCVLYLYGDASSESIFQIGMLGEATLYPVGSGSPALSFTRNPIVNSATEDNVSITLNIVNNGSIFKDAITFHTWDCDLSYEYCGSISQYAMIEEKEMKALTFSFPYEGVVGHTYLVNIYANNAIIKGYTSNVNYTCSFTLEEGKETWVKNLKANLETIIANDNNVLTITTNSPIKNIKAFSTAGMLITNEDFDATSTGASISFQSQQAGVYIINIETTEGLKTSKVVIK